MHRESFLRPEPMATLNDRRRRAGWSEDQIAYSKDKLGYVQRLLSRLTGPAVEPINLASVWGDAPKKVAATKTKPKKKAKPALIIDGTIHGYACLWWDRAISGEQHQPGCFTEILASGDNVELRDRHDGEVIARTSDGSMILTQDQKGLRFDARPYDTAAGRDAFVRIAHQYPSSKVRVSMGNRLCEQDENLITQVIGMKEISLSKDPRLPTTRTWATHQQ